MDCIVELGPPVACGNLGLHPRPPGVEVLSGAFANVLLSVSCSLCSPRITFGATRVDFSGVDKSEKKLSGAGHIGGC